MRCLSDPIPVTHDSSALPADPSVYLFAASSSRTFSSTLAITSGSGTTGAHLSGGASVTVAAVGGVATFGSLSIDSAGTNYTLRATSGALTAAISSIFNITVGPAAKLGFLVRPSNTASGASITPAVQVEVRDAGGNRITTATTSITLAIGTNPSGGILSGGGAVAAVGGVASFSNLSIDKGGTGYTLTAAGGALTGATSSTFNITGGTPDHLGFFVQPSNDTAGSPISPAVQVEVLDAAGNRVTTDTRNITVAILDNPGGGTLSGTKTVAASAGVASFSNLSIDKAGTGYTLVATSSPALTSVTSADFDIAPGAPSRAHFFVEPSSATAGVAIAPDIQVEILDAYDLKRWWWKGTDGIRETTWPGVYNRSRLPGRNDYFQLPDWDCYSLSGRSGISGISGISGTIAAGAGGTAGTGGAGGTGPAPLRRGAARGPPALRRRRGRRPWLASRRLLCHGPIVGYQRRLGHGWDGLRGLLLGVDLVADACGLGRTD